MSWSSESLVAEYEDEVDDDSSGDSDSDDIGWSGVIGTTLLQPTHLQRTEQIRLLLTHLQYFRFGSQPVFLHAHFCNIDCRSILTFLICMAGSLQYLAKYDCFTPLKRFAGRYFRGDKLSPTPEVKLSFTGINFRECLKFWLYFLILTPFLVIFRLICHELPWKYDFAGMTKNSWTRETFYPRISKQLKARRCNHDVIHFF